VRRTLPAREKLQLSQSTANVSCALVADRVTDRLTQFINRQHSRCNVGPKPGCSHAQIDVPGITGRSRSAGASPRSPDALPHHRHNSSRNSCPYYPPARAPDSAPPPSPGSPTDCRAARLGRKLKIMRQRRIAGFGVNS
jgi:hypothetical protein